MIKREMTRGDTLVFDAYAKDAETGGAVDLTGASARMTAKKNYADPDAIAVVRLDTGALGGVAVLDAATGKLRVTIPPAATAGLADATVTLVYDVQVRDSSGRVRTVETGTIAVSPDVTRAYSVVT